MNSVPEFIFCPLCDDLITNQVCKCGHIIKCEKCSVIHPPITSNIGDQCIVCPTCTNGFETLINYFPNNWQVNLDEKSITMIFDNIPNRRIVVKTIIENPAELLRGNIDISYIKLLKNDNQSNDELLLIEKEYILGLLICFFPYGENTNSIDHYHTFTLNVQAFKVNYSNPEFEERRQRNENVMKYINMYFDRLISQRFIAFMATELIFGGNQGGIQDIDHSDDIPMYAASKKEIDKLNDTSIKFLDLKEKKNVACPICLVDFEDEDKISNFECCDTTFHNECITKWLTESNHNCPMCRTELEKSDEKL